MGRTEHIGFLSDLDLFSGCSKKDLNNIAKAADEVEVAAGDMVVDQGDQGTETFVILSGEAVVKRNGRKIATLKPGDSIGELSLLDHGPRTATVIADSDMQLLRLKSRDFARILKDSPTIAIKLAATLAAKVRELDRKIFG
ncbi:MAG: cyclic nucleotide-binding domain-containing protein [Actinomycetia bacterium]|nr:cyclic nucleotide-binding domain-containing protein [Actinomycetes bacterium]MCP4963352.1 cyclic nucleotide-binding domain-containing protein [Actinomycetes bacterium]